LKFLPLGINWGNRVDPIEVNSREEALEYVLQQSYLDIVEMPEEWTEYKRDPGDQELYESLLSLEKSSTYYCTPAYQMALTYYRLGYNYNVNQQISQALESENQKVGPRLNHGRWDMRRTFCSRWLRSPYPDITIGQIERSIKQSRYSFPYKAFKEAVKIGRSAVESYIVLSSLGK
jgi:hypothetical protein